jgi:NADH-quinone oxidoreductase subunit M
MLQKMLWLALAGACGTVSRFAMYELAAKSKLAHLPIGTFAVNHWLAVAASVAVVLGAIYLLWSYQRVALGPIREEHRGLRDVTPREVLVLAPVLALLLVFGVFPTLMTAAIDPATRRVIEHVQPDHPTTVVTGVEVADEGSGP